MLQRGAAQVLCEGGCCPLEHTALGGTHLQGSHEAGRTLAESTGKPSSLKSKWEKPHAESSENRREQRQ